MIRDLLSKEAAALGIELSENMLTQFEKYAALLKEWNEKINLTAITDDEGIAYKHFLDSLALLKQVDIPKGAEIADVGTGAGFPGVVLKIARPDLELTLIDSLQKRLNFLDTVLKELDLKAELRHSRAEDAGHEKNLREKFDFVTARAVANLAVLSEYCLPLCKVGGFFVPMKTAEVAPELSAAENAVKLLGGEIKGAQFYNLPVAGGRSVVLIEKVSATPPKYPRQRVKISDKPL